MDKNKNKFKSFYYGKLIEQTENKNGNIRNGDCMFWYRK